MSYFRWLLVFEGDGAMKDHFLKKYSQIEFDMLLEKKFIYVARKNGWGDDVYKLTQLGREEIRKGEGE